MERDSQFYQDPQCSHRTQPSTARTISLTSIVISLTIVMNLRSVVAQIEVKRCQMVTLLLSEWEHMPVLPFLRHWYTIEESISHLHADNMATYSDQYLLWVNLTERPDMSRLRFHGVPRSLVTAKFISKWIISEWIISEWTISEWIISLLILVSK